jgi:hypothetical protein
MGNLIRIKKDDPAYDRAFKHGATFALFVYAFFAMMNHDPVMALGAFGGAIAMAIV